MHRLSQPIGDKGSKRAPGGYRSQGEWFHKSCRLAALQRRLDGARAEREAGVVHVVRGGRKLLKNRYHLEAAQLTSHWFGLVSELARLGPQPCRQLADASVLLG